METIAIIPARGGSKGIPRKNMVNLEGRPLIDYTIEAAINSRCIDGVYVSSDDTEILGYASKRGVVGIKRPDELAADDALTAPVINHVIDMLQRQAIVPKWIVLLQPTSPLRTAEDIDSAFRLMVAKQGKSLVSVVVPKAEPYKALVLNEKGYLKGLINDNAPFIRRQDCPRTFYANGAIYIFRLVDFVSSKTIPLNRAVAYEMDYIKSYDVDTHEDLEEIKKVIRNEFS